MNNKTKQTCPKHPRIHGVKKGSDIKTKGIKN